MTSITNRIVWRIELLNRKKRHHSPNIPNREAHTNKKSKNDKPYLLKGEEIRGTCEAVSF